MHQLIPAALAHLIRPERGAVLDSSLKVSKNGCLQQFRWTCMMQAPPPQTPLPAGWRKAEPQCRTFLSILSLMSALVCRVSDNMWDLAFRGPPLFSPPSSWCPQSIVQYIAKLMLKLNHFRILRHSVTAVPSPPFPPRRISCGFWPFWLLASCS